MAFPIVTLAVALCNNEQYVERCLDSIANQTYRHLQVIVVDDGSKDGSLKRCEKYKFIYNYIIISKENGGLSTARQLALDKASGEYISFIDADDYLVPTYVENLLQKITSDSSDICVCGTSFVDPSGNILHKYSNSFKCNDSEGGEKLTCDKLVNGFSLNIYLSDSWNKLYRTNFIRNSGVKFCLPKGFNGSDSAFNMKLAFHEPVYSTISNEDYIHVIYNSSAVHRRNKNLILGFHLIIEQLLEEAIYLNKEPDLRLYIRRKYFEYLRYATQDQHEESDGRLFEFSYATQIISLHNQFLSSHSWNGFRVSELNTFSSKIFLILFCYSPLFLNIFLKIRRMLVSNV